MLSLVKEPVAFPGILQVSSLAVSLLIICLSWLLRALTAFFISGDGEDWLDGPRAPALL